MNTCEANVMVMLGAGVAAVRARGFGCVVTEECVEDPRDKELRSRQQAIELDIEKRSRRQTEALQAVQRTRCEQCAQQMGRLFENVERDIQTQLIELAIHIAEMILRREMPDADMLRRVLRDALEPLSDFQGVRVRLTPEELKLLRGNASGHDAPSVRGMEWVADPNLSPGDVMVESRNGIFDGRLRQRINTLAEAIEKAVHRAPGEPSTTEPGVGDVKASLDLDVLSRVRSIPDQSWMRSEGRVTRLAGLTVESAGPLASVGDLAWIETVNPNAPNQPIRYPAEVVGFHERSVILMPIEYAAGIRPGDRVLPAGRMQVSAGSGLLGRVVDGLGRLIDDGPPIRDVCEVDIERAPPLPLQRRRLNEVFHTGIRALDACLTCAKGQRIGIFAGSGVGKSVLLGSLARHSSATVNVIALIGERGREVRDFLERDLGEGLKKSVVVAVTSDQSPLLRRKGASTAMAIAEYFRDRGEDVLLLMDSVTRYAMAQREIGLAIGEPPTTRGYPPSVFGMLARLLERPGTSPHGSMTAFFSVLVEADDMNDPIGDSVRSILDGHVVLSRELAEANHYPAVDILMSISRLMSDVAPREQQQHAGRLRELLSVYRRAEDLVNVGAYVAGSNPRIDEALAKIEAIRTFLKQRPQETSTLQATMEGLAKAVV